MILKKVTLILLIITLLMITVSVVVYAKDFEFHNGVYRGEKWEFDIDQPNKNYITIIPQDRPEPKVYGKGYVGRVELPEKEYEIFLLGQ